MEDLAVGSLVAPIKQEWGHGIIWDIVGDKAHVYFVNQPEPDAKLFPLSKLRPADVEQDADLSNLSFVATTGGRFRLAARKGAKGSAGGRKSAASKRNT